MSGKSFKIIIYICLIIFLGYKYGFKTYFYYQAQQQSLILYQSISNDTIPWQKLGYSALGNTIYLAEFGESEDVTLILGGIHGDEYGSFDLAYKTALFLNSNPDEINKKAVIVPILNPDGLFAGKRGNSNGVDINKNFPSRNWSPVYQDDDFFPGSEPSSEAETLLIMKILNTYKPQKIISLHSKLNRITYSGPARGLANNIAQNNGYSVEGDLKNAGSLEEYLGQDMNISCININLPEFDPEQSWLDNKSALINAINY